MMKDSSPAASIQVAIFDLFKIISDRLKRVSLPADVNSPLPREALGETRLPYREINSPQPSR